MFLEKVAAAVTCNINRSIGIEGGFGSMIATTSDLQFGDLSSDALGMACFLVRPVQSRAQPGLMREVKQ